MYCLEGGVDGSLFLHTLRIVTLLKSNPDLGWVRLKG